MSNTYIIALIESLEKKINVLNRIKEMNEKQAALLKEDPISFDKLDKNFEEKGVLIYRLSSLDDGFETLFSRVREELTANKSLYSEEIKKMQELITVITELSATIQADEARNKQTLDNLFRNERANLRMQRSGINAVKSYSQAMNFKKP